MLLTPSYKYIQYIYLSAHYLNCPKHMLNHQIHTIIRLCKGHLALAKERVKQALDYYEIRNIDIDKLIEYHWNIKESEFNKINVNPYIDKLPEHIKKRNTEINRWFETNTDRATIFRPYDIVPSYPFKK